MTYYEWIEYFENLKKAPISDEPINLINNSNIDYQGNIKVRYLNHIVKVINFRLNDALDRFIAKSKTIKQDKDSIAIEVNDLKKEVIFSKKLASTKYFDENVKKDLINNINNFAEEMKKTVQKIYENCNNNEILMIINNIDFNA